MKKIGFIGIGVMGCAMASNLMKKGYELTVYTRTKQKAEVLLEKGAKWCDTAADCAKGQDAGPCRDDPGRDRGRSVLDTD